MDPRDLACIPKQLHPDLHVAAAKIAVDHNPVNAPSDHALRALNIAGTFQIARIALLTTKYWGAKGVDLGVRFMDTSNTGLKAKILAHMNAWNQWANVRFRESASGQVRIALSGNGYWSYMGTDILSIPSNEPTMTLQDFSLSTPDSEYLRVVRHETGHTLGFPHEHQRAEVIALLDEQKTVAWFAANVGWDATEVHQQIFDPLNPADLLATPVDVTSIMAYQFAGACTKSGQPIPGGLDIDPTDGAFAGKIYPLATTPVNPPSPPTGAGNMIVTFGGGTMTLTGNHAALSLGVTGTKSADVPHDNQASPAPAHSFAILAFLAKYGPIIEPLIEEYGPKVLSLIQSYLRGGLSGSAILGQLHEDLSK